MAQERLTKYASPHWSKLITREGVDLTSISQIDLVFYDLFWTVLKARPEVLFTLLEKRRLTHYYKLNYTRVGRQIYHQYFNHPRQIIKYYSDGKKLKKSIVKDTVKWSKKLNNNLSAPVLAAAFQNFRRQFKTINYIYSITSWNALEVWQVDFETLLNRLIKKNGLEKQTDRILASAYHPWRKTAVAGIQKKLSRGVSPKKLAKDYQFLRSWVAVWYKPIDAAWIRGLKKPTGKNQTKIYSLPKLISLLKPDRTEKHFFELAPYLVFFKDWRDDIRRFQAYEWSFLFDELAQYFKIEHNDFGYLSLDEIAAALKNNRLDKQTIAYRKKHDCIITVAGRELKIKVLDRQIPKKYYQIMAAVETLAETEIIKGRIAQPGMAKGIVKIIRSVHDLKNVHLGQILVANTTHPDYLPAMQKAAAFITNEGGLISHAAIVARELKKPCIVGTGNATKILADGDLVEVNANKGEVKILKK